VIETTTPLAVGSGEKNSITDQVIARDVNGLPYIPGTAIAGIIRHAIGEETAKSFFGYGGNKKGTGKGSEIIFSSAQIMNEYGEAVEGLIDKSTKSVYLENFDELPIRQHVRINSKGTAEKRGKFDEEVVYKGTRFCFEVELFSKNNADENFQKVLNELSKNTLRIGGGTRKGFGEFKITDYKVRTLDFKKEMDLVDYINKTSSLNDSDFWKDEKLNAHYTLNFNHPDDWTTYQLVLRPDDFFLFGSGFGDEDADMISVSEKYFDWSTGKPEVVEDAVLIPGSSVKGALSHRIAFHYNKIKKYFAGDPDAKTGIDNYAVHTLFGYSTPDDKTVVRGNILVSDLIQAKLNEQKKTLNHVSIDRFTGGAIEGALFSENVIYGKGETYTLNFTVLNDAIKDDDVKNAFENTLHDITTGLLPLGGGSNRGHGCFTGTWKIIKEKEEVK